jgi:hypothetical protein
MNQVIAVLTSPKARIPLVCVAGSVELLLGLIWGGVMNVEQTAILVVVLYAASKVGMAAAALWVGWRHRHMMKDWWARRLARTARKEINPRG